MLLKRQRLQGSINQASTKPDLVVGGSLPGEPVDSAGGLHDGD